MLLNNNVTLSKSQVSFCNFRIKEEWGFSHNSWVLETRGQGNGRTIIDSVGFLIAAYERGDTCYKPFEFMWPFYGAKER